MATDASPPRRAWKSLLGLGLLGVAAIAAIAVSLQRQPAAELALSTPPPNALAACIAGQEAVFAPIDGQLPGPPRPMILQHVPGEATRAVSLRADAVVRVDVSDPPRVRKRDAWSTAPPLRSVPLTSEFARSLGDRLQSEISWAKPAMPPGAPAVLYFYRDARGRCAWSGVGGSKGHLADWVQMFDALHVYAGSDTGSRSVAANEAHLQRRLQRLVASADPPADPRLFVFGIVLAIAVAVVLFYKFGGPFYSLTWMLDPPFNRHPIVQFMRGLAVYVASFAATGALFFVQRERLPFSVEALPYWLQAVLLVLMPIPGVLVFHAVALGVKRLVALFSQAPSRT